MYPILPDHAMKDVPKTVQIYQYDASPTAGRQPLLVVPGRNDERYRCFHMQDVCRSFSDDPRIQKRYKMFLIRYNTLAPGNTNVNQFKSAIRELSKEEGQPLAIVAPSIAGNITRKAIADPLVDPSVDKLITLGSPFHGSPLFNRDWIVPSLLAHHAWPVRITRTLAFNAFFKRNTYLMKNYHWDNFDQQAPLAEAVSITASMHASDKALPSNTPPIGDCAMTSGDKVIAYAGYIETDRTKGVVKKKVPVLSQIASIVHTSCPAFLGKQHPMLRYLNREIAREPVNDRAKGDYAFNDGIVPVSSALSLSSAVPIKLVDGTDPFAQIRDKVGVKKARLFPNIDHVTFMYGTGPSGRDAALPDELSPTEKPRTIFEWLASDLLDPADEQLSAAPSTDKHVEHGVAIQESGEKTSTDAATAQTL